MRERKRLSTTVVDKTKQEVRRRGAGSDTAGRGTVAPPPCRPGQHVLGGVSAAP